jgi:hypothetical protein
MVLHDHTAAAGLLWRIGVLALRNSAPDGRNHVVPGTVAVGDDAVAMLITIPYALFQCGTIYSPFGCCADRNAFSLKILAQAVVKLS